MRRPFRSPAARLALPPLALALTAAGAVASVPVAPPAAAATTVTVERAYGPDRYGTAAAASATTFASGVSVVYVATGRSWPDALAAGPLADGAGPVLLVSGSTIPAATSAEVTRVHPGRIVLLGGTGAVPDSVGQTLARLSSSGSWSRLAGGDRYATAARFSQTRFASGASVAYIATGASYADALTGSALGARNNGPLLLTTRDTLPAPTATELARLHPSRIVVLGGTGAVSASVESRLRSYAGSVVRIAGSDRYETAAKALAEVPSSTNVVLATGANFPDAVTGGAVAAADSAVLVPVPGRVDATASDELAALAPSSVVMLGGTAALPSTVPSQVGSALGATVTYSETVRPVATTVTTDPATAYEQRIFTLVNAERAKAGLEALTLSSCASRFAQTWSDHMASTGDFSHQSLTPILSTCAAHTAGENIAYGNITADQMMTNWMNSTGHRANILNPAFTSIGIGATRTSSGRWYATQDFLG